MTDATFSAATSVIRSVAPVRRRADHDWPEFSRHWRDEHAAIARRMPGMIGYVQGHAHPGEQPVDRPDSWRYDGCPFASFPDVAAIEELRGCPAYHAEAVPDESAFLDRESMSAVLLHDEWGDRPDRTVEGGRTLLLFVRAPGADGETGRAVEAALRRLDGADQSLGTRWSVALEADPGLSPGRGADKPFDALLEVWFADVSAAVDLAAALVAGGASLPVDFFCLVVQELRVI